MASIGKYKKYEYLKKGLSWMAVKNIYPEGFDVFTKEEDEELEIDPEDIDQDSLGTCYLLSSLAVLAEPRKSKQNSDLIKRLFHPFT